MRRQVDHHLARARAVGRRAVGLSRANVATCAEAVERAVARLYPEVRFDIDGSRTADVAIERQDLDEILGNLIENAAKYGGGSVFVTVDADPEAEDCAIWVEDDGLGIPEGKARGASSRAARGSTPKSPGTGLGLAIVRDVAEIYGGIGRPGRKRRPWRAAGRAAPAARGLGPDPGRPLQHQAAPILTKRFSLGALEAVQGLMDWLHLGEPPC